MGSSISLVSHQLLGRAKDRHPIPQFQTNGFETFNNISVGTAPLGIGIGVNAGNEFVFTANFGATSVSSFLVTNSTTLNPPPTVALGYNAPKGLVVDPQNAFVYTADSGDGTVSQSTINGSCGSSICTGPTVSTENPANPNSGPFGVTLAQ